MKQQSTIRLWVRQTKAVGTAVIAALAVTACAEQLSSPIPRRSRANDAGGGSGPLVANNTRYRDAGAHPATGRSGSASLMSRSLLGKDGQTTVDLSTGTVGQPGAPGQIAKVQTKLIDFRGVSLGVFNDKPSTVDGTASRQFAGLVRLDTVQVQANVRGIDGSRTDVVTVNDVVRLRPDLAVGNVQAPGRVLAGPIPTHVTALVQELNHDVGAQATCALSVDGVQVDQAEGIWVDAGDAVTCSFGHVFAQSDAGIRNLTVSVVSVAPGDWDLSNNSASTTLEVDRDAEMVRSGNAFQSVGTSANDNDLTLTSPCNSSFCTVVQYTYHTVAHNLDQNQQSSLTASTGTELRFPAAHVELAQTSGGATLDAQTFDNLDATSHWGDETDGGACYSNVNAGVEVDLCSAHSGGAGSTSLYYARNGGAVTYLSYDLLHLTACVQGWYCYLDYYYYYYNTSTTLSQTGAGFIGYGGDFAFHATVTSTDFTTFVADVGFPLVDAVEQQSGQYRYCYGPFPDGTYTYTTCYFGGYDLTTRSGSGSAGP